jgi:hypothetical protein
MVRVVWLGMVMDVFFRHCHASTAAVLLWLNQGPVGSPCMFGVFPSLPWPLCRALIAFLLGFGWCHSCVVHPLCGALVRMLCGWSIIGTCRRSHSKSATHVGNSNCQNPQAVVPCSTQWCCWPAHPGACHVSRLNKASNQTVARW